MLREGRILFACVLCLSRCHTVLKKNEKMSLRILPKWRCVPIVVMSQNEFRDSITEDRGVVSNVVTGFEYHIWKNEGCACGEL